MITDLYIAYVWLPGEENRRVFTFLDRYDRDAFVNRVRDRCRVENATGEAYELHNAIDAFDDLFGGRHIVGDAQGA